MSTGVITILCIMGALNLATIGFLVFVCIKVNRLQALYERTLAKFNNTANIKETFDGFYARLKTTETFCENTETKLKQTEEHLKKAIQKVGLVKYNAMDESENKLSFSLALLDSEDNGIVLNNIYTKHGSFFYTRLVETGKKLDRASEEEIQAIQMAQEDKEYVKRKTVEKAQRTNKRRSDKSL